MREVSLTLEITAWGAEGMAAGRERYWSVGAKEVRSQETALCPLPWL